MIYMTWNLITNFGSRVTASYYSDVLAEWNEWVADPPNPNWFNSDATSTIQYIPWIPGDFSPPIRNVTKNIVNEAMPLSKNRLNSESYQINRIPEHLRASIELRVKGLFDSAIIKLQQFFSEEVNVHYLPMAVWHSMLLYRHNPSMIRQQIEMFWNNNFRYNIHVGLALSNILLSEGQLEQSIKILTSLWEEDKAHSYEKSILLQGAKIKLKYPQADLPWISPIEILHSKYPNDPAVKDISWCYFLESIHNNQISPPMEKKELITSSRSEYINISNYPNPFNPFTTIEIFVPTLSKVSITVYDCLGRKMETIKDNEIIQGYLSFPFDGTRFSSGIYFLRVQAKNIIINHKLLLIK